MRFIMRNMSVVLALVLILSVASGVLAEEKKGGPVPGLVSFFLGPRIGLEMNEGEEVEGIEGAIVLDYVVTGGLVRLYVAYDHGYKSAGLSGCLASCCLGPRVGRELPERNIRTKEWLQLIPVVGIVPRVLIAVEAYDGKTMTEIAEEEGLSKK